MSDENVINLSKKNLHRQISNLLGTESFVTLYVDSDGNLSYIIDSEKIELKDLAFMNQVFKLIVDEIIMDAIKVEPHE